MSLISLKNVSKSYYDKIVLADINLQINAGERLAIIGENGTGKTTLFRLILGLEQADSENSEIIIAENTVLGYLEQQLNKKPGNADALFDPEIFNLQQTLHHLEQQISASQTADTDIEHQKLLNQYSIATAKFESLGGYSFQYRMAEILAGLGIDLETARRPFKELSGGEKMRVELARLLIREPDVMLLDEPTNHLDHKAIEWLEEFLRTTKSTILVISHDRLFLDRIATRTSELSAGKLTVFPGNYSNFVRLKSESEKSLAGKIKKLENDLTKQIKITQTMLSHRKISSYRSSQKKAARLSQQLSDLKDKKSTGATRLNINVIKKADLGDPTRTLISAKDLSVQFPGANSVLFKPFNWSLQGKQKVVIVGANGCGKTTLIRSLLGLEPNAQGFVEFATDIKYGFLGQLIEFSNETQSVIESLSEVQENWNETTARNELAKYGFRGIDVFKPLNTLSGGERSRLYLCHLLSENPDILFLDEPTNHLDINSCEILERALVNYNGSIIAVSHDRYFIDKIAQYVLGFVDHEIIRFNNYQGFRQAEKKAAIKRKAENTKIKEITKNNRKSEEIKPETEQKNSLNAELWNDQEIKLHKSLNRIKRLPANQVQVRRFKALANESLLELMQKLEIAENKKLELEAKFASANDNTVYLQYNEMLILIDQYESIYLKLAEILENINEQS